MRVQKLLVAAALVVSLPSLALGQDAFDARPGIAVFPFTNGGSLGPDSEDLTPLEVGVQQMLLTELAQNPALRIIERSRLREILDEQGLVADGHVDPRTAADIGRLVGARYIITGVFMDLYGVFRLDGRVIDVETGEIVRSQEVRDQKQNIYSLLFDLAAGITAGANLPPLPTPVAQERRTRQIPPEAVSLYSRAQVFEDAGERDRAVELYRQIAQTFPEMTEAQEALRQLTTS
jgi:TolB-like protein